MIDLLARSIARRSAVLAALAAVVLLLPGLPSAAATTGPTPETSRSSNRPATGVGASPRVRLGPF